MVVYYSFHVKRTISSDLWQMYFEKNQRKPNVPANECLEDKNNDLSSVPWTVDITKSSEKLNIQILTFEKQDVFA